MMKLIRLLILISSTLLWGCVPMWPTSYPGGGQGGGGTTPPSTPNPTPVPTTNRGVTVNNIRLTDQYTIVNMTFANDNRPRFDQNGRQLSDGSEPVAFHVNAELIALQGARHFKFVRAEGIPTNRNFSELKNLGTRTMPGDRLNFTIYFERLDRGIEDFDLFECQDADTYTCWNQYNLRVNNPANVPTSQPSSNPQTTPPTSTPK